MQSKTPPTLAELEQLHKDSSAQLDKFLKEYGESHELRTMRSAILHIEEKITELRSALQVGMQEISKEVSDLNSSMQSGTQKIQEDVEKLNSAVNEDLEEIEKELKNLHATTDD